MAEPLPTVVLEHRTGAGRHYDWLLGDPRDPTGRLWTARVTAPPSQWKRSATWLLEPIAPHRRLYLTYEGPLSEGRGRVKRVAQGTHQPILWTDDRIVTDIDLTECAGRIAMDREASGRWRATWVQASE